jgi:hypothetical protein
VGRASLLALTVLLAACVPVVTPRTSPDATVSPELTPGPSPTATQAPIAVMTSKYGSFEIKTQPLDSCELAIKVDPGILGDGPPTTLSGKADVSGVITWTYPTPMVPTGRGRHEVTCSGERGKSDARSEFDVTLKSLDAKGFTTRIEAVDPVNGLAGVTPRLEPSLVPARDADIVRMTATLVNEWRLATRGLGALTLVESSADVVIYVLPGKGTSLHVLAPDGSQRVLVYAVDEFGTVSAENSVAVTLHELGHIWCCFGPGAGSDGHWLEAIADPLLQGVDRYGLMTHPVTCLVGRGFESCPNRFSERELRTMGFTEIPAPPPDPCIAQRNALSARLATQNASIDAAKAQAAVIKAKIDQIVAQYPSRQLPPDVYSVYIGLVGQYNTLASDIDAMVAVYNGIVAQLNALPC